MQKTLQTICQKINFDHKTYQIEYNQRDDFILSAHCCSYLIKWNPNTQEIQKQYYPGQLSSFTSFKFVKHRKLILLVIPCKLVLLDYNLKETNSYSFEGTQSRFQNNYCISDTRLYIQADAKIYIFSLNNLRLLKIHDPFQTDSDEEDNQNNSNQQIQHQRLEQNNDKILFDIYGETIVHYDGKKFCILPDQICQQRSNSEAEIERIVTILNKNKLVKNITSFYFFSQSSLLILSNSVKTVFLNLHNQSFLQVKNENCTKVVKDPLNNIFYWVTQKYQHYVTFLDFKVTQKVGAQDIKTPNSSFVINNKEKVSFIMSNESLKKLRFCQVNNFIQPFKVFSKPKDYLIHHRLEFIKTCFQKEIINDQQLTDLYQRKAINVDENLYYHLFAQQRSLANIAELIQLMNFYFHLNFLIMQAIIQKGEKVKHINIQDFDFDKFQQEVSYSFGISKKFQVINYVNNQKCITVDCQQKFQEILNLNDQKKLFQISKNDLFFSIKEIFDLSNQEIDENTKKVDEDIDIQVESYLKSDKLIFENLNQKNKKNGQENSQNKIINKKIDNLNDQILEQYSKIKKLVKKKQNIINKGYKCNNCNKKNFEGLRFECMICENFNLCDHCEEFVSHDHNMVLINNKKIQQQEKIKY